MLPNLGSSTHLKCYRTDTDKKGLFGRFIDESIGEEGIRERRTSSAPAGARPQTERPDYRRGMQYTGLSPQTRYTIAEWEILLFRSPFPAAGAALSRAFN